MKSHALPIAIVTVALICGALVINWKLAPQTTAFTEPTVSVSSTPPVAQPIQVVQRAPAEESAPTIPNAIQLQLNKISRIEKCYESDCDYDQSYPRAYGYAVGRDLKSALIDLAVLARTQHYKLSSLSDTARHFLRNDDGHVKEGALRLLATQPPSPESLNAILNDIIGDTDAQLIEPALRELRKYPSPSDRALIEQRLAASLLTGSPFVAEAISENLGPFINNSSLATFQDAAAQASEGSRIRSNLRAQLADYEKRQSGG